MSIASTGHAEIDHQHEILDNLVARLEKFCPVALQSAHPNCQQCAESQLRQCKTLLHSTVEELDIFMTGHSTYEERMMELLPDTPACKAHITAHKAAHQGVSRELKKLANRVASDSPLAASTDIWSILSLWLGDHSTLFDRRLIHMAYGAQSELNYDGELVDMLDEYVFPNRPTTHKFKPGDDALAQRHRQDVRECFESLTAAQRQVFWQAVNGKKNREIAAELGISTNTVKTHRSAIFLKMGVNSVVELIKKSESLR